MKKMPLFVRKNFHFYEIIDLRYYKSDCATHEKEKNYHESTKYRKHEKNISNLIV